MTAINHALTGSLIGLAVHQPLLAIPAAFLSHIVCDIIPHYGNAKDEWIASRGFRNYLALDALLCVLLVVLLAASRPSGWALAAVCAFVATSPDFLWISKFVAARRGQHHTFNRLEKFLADIQWFQRPIGAFVEMVWFVGASVLLLQML